MRCAMTRGGLARTVALALAALASCTAETGILVAVTGGSVDELELHVGLLDDAGDYVLDPSISGERVKVRGRNLRAEPYELLIREEQDGGDPLSVRALALAFREEGGAQKLVGFGALEPPQSFVRGEVLRRAVSIGSVDGEHGVHVGQSCVRAWSGEARLDLVAPDDRDCDGSPNTGAQRDCNDHDAAIRPDAIELCDGKDNNCDGAYAPEKRVCYAKVGEACQAGTRVCGDARGQGYAGDCAPSGKQEPFVLCSLYAECGRGDPALCVEELTRSKLSCTVEVNKVKGELCAGAHPLQAPSGARDCYWEVAAASGYGVKLKAGDQAGERIDGCEASLFVYGAKAMPPAPGSAAVYFGGHPPALLEVLIQPKPVEACSPTPLKCS